MSRDISMTASRSTATSSRSLWANGQSTASPVRMSAPALLIQMSMGPHSSQAVATSLRHSSSWTRLPRSTSAVPPRSAMASATSSAAWERRPCTITAAPAAASSSAMARPMPAVEPVTMALRPVSSLPGFEAVGRTCAVALPAAATSFSKSSGSHLSQSSCMVSPTTGWTTAGAISASGSRTKPRSCIRGCGIVKSGSSWMVSP